MGDCTHVRAEDCYEPGAHLKVRRRTPEEREAYLEAKVPEVAKRFDCTEEEARLLLHSIDEGGGTLVVLPDPVSDEEAQAAKRRWLEENKPAGRFLEARESSVRFVLERLGDDPEFPDGMTFRIETDGTEREAVSTGRHRCCMYSAEMATLAGTVRAIGEALGIEVIER